MRVLFAFLALLATVRAHLVPSSSWTALNDMPVGRSDAPAVAVNGIIYVAGGCVAFAQPVYGTCDTITQQQLAYDTNQGPNANWTVLAPMPRPRYRQAVTAVGNLVYHVGGRTLIDDPINEVDVYNITSNTWFTLPNQTCNCLNSSDATSFAIGTKLYYTGGYRGPNYDTLASTMVLDTSLPVDQQQFRAGIVPDKWWIGGDLSAVTINDIGYVMGGWATDPCIPLSTVSAYNATSNTWMNKTNFKHPRGDFAIYGESNRYIFVAGGETKAAGCRPPPNVSVAYPVGDVERYDTWTDTWIDYNPIAITSFRFTGVAIKDVLYAIGGQGEDAAETWNNQTQDAFPLLPELYYLNTTAFDLKAAASSSSSSSSSSLSSLSSSSSSTGSTGTSSNSSSSSPVVPPSSTANVGVASITVSSTVFAVMAVLCMALL